MNLRETERHIMLREFRDRLEDAWRAKKEFADEPIVISVVKAGERNARLLINAVKHSTQATRDEIWQSFPFV